MEKTELTLCDADVLIEFLDRGNDTVKRKLLKVGYKNLCISQTTASEIFVGALNKEHYNRLNKFISSLIIIPLTSEIGNIHLNLVKEFCLSHKLKVPDALIAATALVFDFPLYSLNTKDFKFIKGLRLL